MKAWIQSALSQCVRSPLFWVLLAAALLRTAGIVWGLPASDGWDDDGIAPRNFLVGVIQTYTPGAHFTYPPLHMLLLILLTAPGTLIAIAHAPSLHPQDVIGAIIQVPYMTFFAIVARIVSVAFSLATIYVIAKLAELIGGKRAGMFAAVACALNGALTYYGQVTNLDGPALFWAVLSVWWWMRVIAEHEPRHVRWAALSAAAAIATKDQTYAIFLVSIPGAFAAWFACDGWARQNAGRIFKSLAFWCSIALVALLALDGALTNPHGFADRLAFLTGSASASYADYQNSWTGYLALLGDVWRHVPRYYPAVTVLLAGLGIAVFARDARTNAPRLIAGALPLLAAISFTIAFNFVALRTDTRFLLPQSVFLAVYIGLAVDWLASAPRAWARLAAGAACVAVACNALWLCAGVDAAFLADPRYDAERWMNTHLRLGDAVETYGLNAYLPRFPQDAKVTRIGPKPPKARNPLPHVTEMQQAYRAVAGRQPRFVVVPGFWVRDYLEPASGVIPSGKVVSAAHQADRINADARGYFGALFGGRLPYRLAHASVYSTFLGPDAEAYESLRQPVFIFERVPARPTGPIVTGRNL